MTSVGAAAATPATRKSLLRRWSIVAALVVVAGTLLGLAAARARSQGEADALRRQGVQVTATVRAIDAVPVGRVRALEGSIVVAYEAAGDAAEQSIFVGDDVGAYRAGQTVDVVYDPGDPARVVLADVAPSRRGPPGVLLLAGAALLGAMAFVAGRHTLHAVRGVRRDPWLPVPSRLAEVPVRYGKRMRARVLVVLELPSGPVWLAPVGLSRVDPSFAPEAWVAGLGTATVALAVPGGGHVVPVTVVGPQRGTDGSGTPNHP